MNANRVRRYFQERLGQQPGTKIQYGHPSPRFWKRGVLELADVRIMRNKDRKLMLYLHIPFCPQTDPPACGFCLFAREDFRGYPAVTHYLDYLKRELDMYATIFEGQELHCIYFGGGTPNILKAREYGVVMDWIRAIFRIAPGAEVTLEGVPQLFGEDRLSAMAEAGVTRVSVGAQQLQDHLIKYSGRHQTAEQVFDTVKKSHELQMVCNVDLICGWFDQTEDDLVSDLRELVALRPESIVVHPLTLAGPSHFAQEKARLPTAAETCRTFLRGRRYLEENGYWGASYTDYMLNDPPRGPKEVAYLRYYRDIMRYDRIGVGYGANSLFAGTEQRMGMTWRNMDNTISYYGAIDTGKLPVLEGFEFTDEDIRLLYIMKGLEGTPFLRSSAYAQDFDHDLASDCAPYFEVLSEMGWLESRDNDEYRVVNDGVFYIPMIQRCIADDRNEELRRATPKRMESLPQIHAV
jgi:oxygen-independent coproporphyrinogen-3 oxidase